MPTGPETPRPGIRPLGWSGVAWALLTVVLWGGNPVAAAYSVDTLPPLAVAALRFALATAAMAVWVVASRAPLRLGPGQWTPVLICGFLLFLQIGTFTWAMTISSASHATLLINSFPLGVVLLERYVTRSDRLTPLRALGVGLAAVGVVLLVLAGRREVDSASIDRATMGGDLLMLFSAAVLSVKVVYTKAALQKVSTGALVLWHDLVGTLLLFAGSMAVGERIAVQEWTTGAVLSLLYQGVLVGGVCFAVQAWLLERHTATQVTVFNFATPLVGVTAAALFRHDSLSPWLLVACLLVTTGILLVNRRGPTRGS